MTTKVSQFSDMDHLALEASFTVEEWRAKTARRRKRAARPIALADRRKLHRRGLDTAIGDIFAWVAAFLEREGATRIADLDDETYDRFRGEHPLPRYQREGGRPSAEHVARYTDTREAV